MARCRATDTSASTITTRIKRWSSRPAKTIPARNPHTSRSTTSPIGTSRIFSSWMKRTVTCRKRSKRLRYIGSSRPILAGRTGFTSAPTRITLRSWHCATLKAGHVSSPRWPPTANPSCNFSTRAARWSTSFQRHLRTDRHIARQRLAGTMPATAHGARIPRDNNTTTHGNQHGQGRQEDTQGQDLRGQPRQHPSAFTEVEGGGEDDGDQGGQTRHARAGQESRGQEGGA